MFIEGLVNYSYLCESKVWVFGSVSGGCRLMIFSCVGLSFDFISFFFLYLYQLWWPSVLCYFHGLFEFLCLVGGDVVARVLSLFPWLWIVSCS